MAPRHPGLAYGHSRGKAPGSKHYYRRTYTVNPSAGWNQFLRAHTEGTLLQVCCGGSRLGGVRVDIDLRAPAVNVLADMIDLPFKEKSFDTVACDPLYELAYPKRIELQRELFRVAKRRVIFKAPWIPRGAGWHLVETVLICSHTCSNVAVLCRLDSAPPAPRIRLG